MPELPLLEFMFAVLFLTALTCGTPQGSRAIVVCAYLVRVVMCYIHAYVVVLPDSQFDAIRFESTAWLWASDQQCVDDFTTGSLLYSWIGSCVYSVFGRAPLLLQILNAFFGTLIVLVAMRTVRMMGAHVRIQRVVGLLLAFHPTLVLYSAITMREVAIVFAFSMSIYSIVKWRTQRLYGHGFFAVTWMIVSQLFHTGMLTGTVLVSALFLYFSAKDHWHNVWSIRVTRRDAKLRFASMSFVALFIIAGTVMVSGGYGLEKIQRLATQGVLQALGGWQEQVARGRAGYLIGLQVDSFLSLGLQIPLRVVYFVSAPFPWDVARLRDVWGFVDGLAMLVLFVGIVRMLRGKSTNRTEFRTVGLLVVLMMLGFAMVTSNYGTAFRHRGKFVPALIVLYAAGAHLGRQNRGSLLLTDKRSQPARSGSSRVERGSGGTSQSRQQPLQSPRVERTSRRSATRWMSFLARSGIRRMFRSSNGGSAGLDVRGVLLMGLNLHDDQRTTYDHSFGLGDSSARYPGH